MLDFNRSTVSEVFFCGDLSINRTNNFKGIKKGQTVSGVSCSGEQRIYEVRGDNIRLDLGYSAWANGEKDIRSAFEVIGPAALRSLEGGRNRLGLRPVNQPQINGENLIWIELSQSRVREDSFNQRSTLRRANWDELDRGAELDSIETLRQAGAIELGTKEEILGSDDKRRFYLCATFEEKNDLFPIVAFVVTRVLPLSNGYSA
jgi:hypothetical protein